MKILIADTDNETIRDVSFILNEFHPYLSLSVINSGKDCLDVVKNGNCPDVIILGTELVDIQVSSLVKQIRDDSDVLVFILSRSKDIRQLVKAFDSGANGYMVKPFNYRIFVASLNALIRRKEWDSQAIKNKIRGK